MLTEEEILRRLGDGLDATLKAEFTKSGDRLDGLGGRLTEVEKLLVNRPGGNGSGGEPQTPGRAVVDSAEFKAFGGSHKRGKFAVDVKSITTVTGSAGAMVSIDRQLSPALMGRQKLTIRDLLSVVPTSAGSIEYPRQSARTNAAAVVTEGSTKPETDYTFSLQTAPVRTIAHWVLASRQVLDDAPQLQATIDSELRYGLQVVEEDEILNGDGTGSHLLGLMAQATAYNSAFATEAPTMFDTLLKAILQCELAGFPATGIVVHPTDLARMLAIKDSQERYIASAGPFSGPINTIWNVPVASSQSMDETEFLVGVFRDGCTLYDRQSAQVLVSTEDDTNFRKNLVTILP